MKKLQSAIKVLVIKFGTSQISIETLELELIKLYSFYANPSEAIGYIEWITKNISDYKNGSTYVLSLTSSGSIVNNFDL